MILAYPDYYNEFTCIASRCCHSCCIGWEIDIDPCTAALYRTQKGELGERMAKNIDWSGEEPHFILGENERCPFLNENNLCDIILSLGEEAISEICTDHPRFRSFLSEREEIGLGLCCEEAGRIIISREKPLEIIEEGEGEYTADEDFLMDLREDIFDIMNERSMPFSRRAYGVLDKIEGRIEEDNIACWSYFMMDLERLDEKWTQCLVSLVKRPFALGEIEKYMDEHGTWFSNLFNYFIFRHLFSALDDGDIDSKILFALLSCRIIAALCMGDDGADLETVVEYARMYSSEIEYSDENLGLMFEKLQ